MSRYGPGKGELIFRLALSMCGLATVVAVLVLRGIPSGPALFEVIVVAGGFFGGSAIWAALRLKRRG